MVLHSVVRHFQQTFGGGVGKPHVIISNLEHDSVHITVHKMEEEGKLGEGMVKGEKERERGTHTPFRIRVVILWFSPIHTTHIHTHTYMYAHAYTCAHMHNTHIHIHNTHTHTHSQMLPLSKQPIPLGQFPHRTSSLLSVPTLFSCPSCWPTMRRE